ncbi:hypothetical protein ES703_17162 [subsurface metagenome]
MDYNHYRLHSSLRFMTPAAFAAVRYPMLGFNQDMEKNSERLSNIQVQKTGAGQEGDSMPLHL